MSQSAPKVNTSGGELCKLQTSSGIGPVRSLPETYKYAREARAPISGGMGPVRSFSERPTSLREVRAPISGGMGPERLLL